MKIIITCPRAPISIEWIKIANRSSHEVILVDSLDYPIGKFYKNTTYIKVPSPKNDFVGYKKEMVKLFAYADMVIPNCEDIFFLSKVRNLIKSNIFFFMPEDKLLFKLHHKYDFFELLNLHVRVPKSRIIKFKEEIQENKNTILKPIYSRFGRNVIRDVNFEKIKDITVSEKHQWVQQKFIRGEAICNYAICEYGKVISHVVYKPKYLLNQAASTYFEYHEDSRCEAFIRQFAKENNYHGQVAFDFIDDGKDLYILECNPRATSGLHLVSNSINITKKGKFEKNAEVTKQSYRVGFSLFILFTFKALFKGEFIALCKDHMKAKDALDGLPFYSQFFALYESLKRAIKYKKDITSACTFDIEYDGEQNE